MTGQALGVNKQNIIQHFNILFSLHLVDLKFKYWKYFPWGHDETIIVLSGKNSEHTVNYCLYVCPLAYTS